MEASTTETLSFIVKIVNDSLVETEQYRDDNSGESKYLQLANAQGKSTARFRPVSFINQFADDQEVAEANGTFRKLVTLHIRIMLLSDIFATAGYSQTRALNTLLQSVTGNGAGDILLRLGSLHRASIWENVMLKAKMSPVPSTSEEKAPAGESAPDATPVSVSSEATTPGTSSTPLATNGSQVEGSVTPTPKQDSQTKANDPKETNLKALKHLASQLPNGLAPFFQCMFVSSLESMCTHSNNSAVVRLFQTRRTPDAAVKQRISEASNVVAEVAIKHLSPRETGKYWLPEISTRQLIPHYR